MLISQVPDGGTAEVREGAADEEEEDNSHEYQTANELFDLMAKNHNFQPSDDETLTTRDLVILYRNIDLGTQLMSNANEFKRKTPNQYVETVVYNDDHDSDSDISEIYSSENLHNVVLINKERIDLLNHPPSLENTLCQKFGDLEIKSSDLTTEYDRQFLFKDPYIKEQLKTLNLMSNTNEYAGTVLPASLLDYICCKRLEDNYNFYMDNIIRYVKNTIEQLKRISNGDYLTDRAKEKWKEVIKNVRDDEKEENTKILETSTSIPLHVERKVTGHTTTWDDIVHSEVDIRYLSKILEKKIVFEVPKLICGSYRLFSKCCEDNLIISCKREVHPAITKAKKEESRVDVVFKLQRSQSGHVMSNISSIMVLQKCTSTQQATYRTDLLPISYTKDENEENTPIVNCEKQNSTNPVILENQDCENIDKDAEKDLKKDLTVYFNHNNIIKLNTDNEKKNNSTIISSDEICFDSDMQINEYYTITTNIRDSENSEGDSPRKPILIFSSESSSAGFRDIFSKKRNNRTEASFNAIPPDELRITMQRLNIQSSLPEESTEDTSINNKRRSPQRNRVKSPYENKSYIIEEKKRKKLLEIRERREKKKIAMSEQCKVSKSKYGKRAILPQNSSSVTKLSITNKSFYNSIYGQTLNINIEPKQQKMKGRNDSKRDSKMSSDVSEVDDDPLDVPVHSKKYTNRNYYLDDTVTEMMYLQMKQKKADNKETFSESTSAVSNDFNANLTMLSQLISPCSITDLNGKDSMTPFQKLEKLNKMVRSLEENGCPKNLVSSQSNNVIIVPVNSPKDANSSRGEKEYLKKSSASSTSVEFRKSIDKIYDLMKKLGKSDGTETKLVKSKFTTTANADKISIVGGRKSSTIQCSDSGTSVKHHLTSSNPSYYSFDKTNNQETSQTYNLFKKKAEQPTTVVPKVIISAKSQTQKVEGEKIKIRRKLSPPSNVDNPLQAISQLLHEFDNVQKTRHKVVEFKPTKKVENSTDSKNGLRQKRYVRSEQHLKDHDVHTDRYAKAKERKPKPGHPDNTKIHTEGKQINRTAKRQVADIIDEYKEARGEAVRGPTKLNARLNSLAQPKKTYVQAHIVECHTKYGKNMVSDRLQRLAAAPLAQIPEKTRVGFANIKTRQKRSGAEAVPVVPTKRALSPTVPLEKSSIHKHQIGTLPEVSKMSSSANEPSYKQSNVVNKPTSILKKKMVAVESYVKNHYGRNLPPPTDPNELMMEGLTSRVPLIPKDIELSSFASTPPLEGSAAIGKRLHNIIDTIINHTPSRNALNAVKVNECSSKYSKDNKDNVSLAINVSKKALSAHSDYGNYVFEDQTSKKNSPIESTHDTEPADCAHKLDTESPLQPFNSTTELEILENALHRRLSVGTFQKRLRLKNLTLTPKQSMQQVLVLQSGDVGSVVVKSTISQNFKIDSSKSETETMSKVSNSNLDWNFAQIPMQIATVGYAFPVIHSVPKCVANDILNIGAYKESKKTSCRSASCSAALKSSHTKCLRESAAQADRHVAITNVIEMNSVAKVDSAIITELADETTGPHKHRVPQMEPSVEKINIVDFSNSIVKENLPNKNQPITYDNKQIETSTSFENQITSQRNHSGELKKVFGPSNRTINQINPIINEPDKNKKNTSNEIKAEELKVEKNTEIVDYTSSLDILAGLLSEIQKITTCQTQLANNETDFQNGDPHKQLMMTLLNDSTDVKNKVQNKPHDIISITSLDKLRQLESNHSIYSYYISNDGDNDKVPNEFEINMMSEIININSKDISCDMQTCADKEVNVDFPKREFVHRCTDKPSRFFPVTVNHATNVSNSLIGVLSEPSTLSMFPYTDTELTNPDTLLVARKQIIELPQQEDMPIFLPQQNDVLVYATKETIGLPKNIDFTEEVPKNNNKDVTLTVDGKCSSIISKELSINLESLHIIPSAPKVKNNFLEPQNSFKENSDFDPIMKMKRDVLVTVYSILVFTVFAALSFPDMLYRA